MCAFLPFIRLDACFTANLISFALMCCAFVYFLMNISRFIPYLKFQNQTKLCQNKRDKHINFQTNVSGNMCGAAWHGTAQWVIVASLFMFLLFSIYVQYSVTLFAFKFVCRSYCFDSLSLCVSLCVSLIFYLFWCLWLPLPLYQLHLVCRTKRLLVHIYMYADTMHTHDATKSY